MDVAQAIDNVEEVAVVIAECTDKDILVPDDLSDAEENSTFKKLGYKYIFGPDYVGYQTKCVQKPNIRRDVLTSQAGT